MDDPRYYDYPMINKREYFAGQALAGICANSTATDHMHLHDIAAWCYEVAEEMLKQSEKINAPTPTTQPDT